MPALGSRPGFDPSLVLLAQTVYLRFPDYADFDAWAQIRAQSRSFLEPWEPLWPSDDLTRASFRRRVRRYHREIREDRAYPFFLFKTRGDVLLGALTLSEIRRGVSQSATLGYWIGEPFAGQGFMGVAVRRLAEFVFQDLRLHRIEAACIPTNEPSQRVLLRCGFRQEGLARGFLKINGRWQDHLLFALLAEDLRSS